MKGHVHQNGKWQRFRKTCLASVALSAILVATAPAISGQISVTDGSIITQNGGAYDNVSDGYTGSALYAANNGSTINGSDLILTSGSYNSTSVVYARNGGKIILSGNTIVSGDDVLSANDRNSQIMMNGGSITASLTAAAARDNSSITLNNVEINTSNNIAAAVQASYGGTLTMTGGSITTTGSGQGVYVSEKSSATLDNVRISSVGGALFNMQDALAATPNLTVKNFTINTSAANAYGLNANIYSHSYLENGSIHTIGQYASGIRATSRGVGETKVVGNSLSIVTEGNNAHGVESFSAIIDLTDTNITVTRASGIYAQDGGTISYDRGTITVAGIGASGAQGKDPGTTITLDSASIITTAANAKGLYPHTQAAIIAKNSNILVWGKNSYGIYSISQGNVIAENTNISVIGKSSYGLFFKGTISYKGGAITVTGVGSFGARIISPGTSLTLDGTVITTTADKTIGLQSEKQAAVIVKNSNITVGGEGSYGVYSTSRGNVTVENTNISVTDQNSYGLMFLGTTAEANSISVTGGSVSATKGTAIGASGGTNILTLSNTSVSGNLLLNAENRNQSVPPYGTKINIVAEHSALEGGARVDQYSTSNLNLKGGSVWTLTPTADGISASDISKLDISDSAIVFAAPKDGKYQTLTVGSGLTETAAVYSASGNTRLTLNTWFNEGGALSNQHTDRLLINGDVEGTTTVIVNGVLGSPGGATSIEGSNLSSQGISLIQVSGQSSATAFRLQGGYTTLAGLPYQYSLHAYGPGSSIGAADENQRLVTGTDPYWDYRLQSVYIAPPDPIDPTDPTDPESPPTQDPHPIHPSDPAPESAPPVRAVAPQVASYLTAPVALFQAGLLDISNLHRRLGEIRDDRATGRNNGTGEFFIRAYGGMYDYHSNRNAYTYGYNANIDYAAVQMGGNLYALESKTGVTRFGLAASIGSLSFDPKNVYGTSSTTLDTWSVSAHATYWHESGWYLDGILSYGQFNGNVSTSLKGHTSKLSGQSFSASLETGYPFNLGEGLILEPQAQLIYQRLIFDRQIDTADHFTVSLGTQDQLTARVGAKLSKSFSLGQKDQLITVYAKLNALHSFTNDGKVFLGDTFRLGRFGSAIEGGLGVNATLSKNLSVFADGAYQHRIGHAGVSGFTLTGGLRYAF